MDDLTMGQRIAERRKLLGISQEALGEKVGVSRQAISKWEADGAVPEIDKLIALSRLFGVSVGWLLGVEELPERQSDELSEAQLKMVEEIVKRYRSEPDSAQTHRTVKTLAGLVCALLLAVTGLWAVRGSDTPDLTGQISQLQSDYSNIRSQLSSLNDRLDDLSQAAEDQEKLLTNYGFELTKLEETARFTFYGIPKTYNENQTATLRVSRGTGEVYHQYLCDWDGLNWTCDIQLPIENGYEFAFLLKDGTTQYIQPLEGKLLSELEDSLKMKCKTSVAAEVGLHPDGLYVSNLSGRAVIPKLYKGTAFWEAIDFIFYVDSQEMYRYSMLENGPYSHWEAQEYISDFSFDHVEARLVIPEVEEGMIIDIRFYVRLSNGMSKEIPVGTWIIQNGKPVAQNTNG